MKSLNPTKPAKTRITPWLSPKEKLAILEQVRGMWKNRRPDPIKELQKMRKEWERPIK